MPSDYTFGRPTPTEVDQAETERILHSYLHSSLEPQLRRKLHGDYLRNSLSVMHEGMQSLHCSRPWLCYWILHAADLLGVTRDVLRHVPSGAICDLLFMCFKDDDDDPARKGSSSSDSGGVDDAEAPMVAGRRRAGFAGGPAAQIPHLATSYAAVCALCVLSDAKQLARIDRPAMAAWLASLRGADGSFAMHTGGERDVRASYCVAVISSLLHLPMEEVCPMPLCAEYVASCQTYEGGFTNCAEGREAHGGYTQCALGALTLLRGMHLIDTHALRRWLAARQLQYEGGFNGRTNKLVDSCYSHWIGSSAAMLRIADSLGNFHAGKPMSLHDLLICDYGQFVDLDSVTIDVDTVAPQMEAFQERAARADADWARRVDEARELRQSSRVADAAPHSGESEAVENNSSEYETISSASCSAGGAPPTGPWTAAYEELLRSDARPSGDFGFHQFALQHYVLRCCQDQKYGGLMDKPGHPNDFYHTCYSLSGLSVASNNLYSPLTTTQVFEVARSRGWLPRSANGGAPVALNADRTAVLRCTNPVFNLCRERVAFALRLFAGRTHL